MKLKDKVAVITGASRGIGLAVARAFAAEGAKVAVCARRGIETAAAEIGPPERVLAMAADVGDSAQAQRFVEAAIVKFGALHILVNNAAIIGRVGSIITPDASDRSDVSDTNSLEESWRKVIDTNLTGAYIMALAAAPRMGGYGRIINVTSGLGRRPKPPWGAYSVSKAGLEALTVVLAKELPKGVLVNMVDPGNVRTSMRAQAVGPEDPSRLAEPSDIAPLFVYLASEECRESGRLFEAWNWQSKI